jgi:hypothetical protein
MLSARIAEWIVLMCYSVLIHIESLRQSGGLGSDHRAFCQTQWERESRREHKYLRRGTSEMKGVKFGQG